MMQYLWNRSTPGVWCTSDKAALDWFTINGEEDGTHGAEREARGGSFF